MMSIYRPQVNIDDVRDHRAPYLMKISASTAGTRWPGHWHSAKRYSQAINRYMRATGVRR